MKIPVATALFVALLAFSSAGAIDLYLQIDGVKGESQDSLHKDWVDVLAVSQGLSSFIQSLQQQSKGRVSFTDFSVSKYIDRWSVPLMQNLTYGKAFETATLDVVRGGKKPLVYWRIKFSDLLITSVSTGGSGGEDRLTESISFAFREIKWEYIEVDETGEARPPIFTSWNVTENAGGEGEVVNSAPIISKLSSQVTDENTVKTVLFTVQDKETPAGNLSVTATSSNQAVVRNDGIVITSDNSRRTARITPVTDQTGDTKITFTVTDGTKSAQGSFLLGVRRQNGAPVITGVSGTLETADNTPIAPFAGSDITDPDGDSLRVTVTVQNGAITSWRSMGSFVVDGPGRISANGSASTVRDSLRGLMLTPTPNQLRPGQTETLTLVVSADDSVNDRVSRSMNVVINAVDDPPQFTAVADQEILEQTELTVKLVARNVDGDDDLVRYSLDGPSGALGATIDPVAGTLRWTPTELQGPGDYSITVIAQDTASVARSGASATSSFAVRVNERNEPPRILYNTMALQAGDSVNLSDAHFRAHDPDNVPVDHVVTVEDITHGQFQLRGENTTSFKMSELSGDLVRFVHDGSSNAPAYTLRISDGALSDSKAAEVFFNTSNAAPIIGNAAITIAEGQRITLSAANFSATDAEDANGSLLFRVSDLSAGLFENAEPRSVTEFSQAAVINGDITFTHNGSEAPPALSVSVTDSGGRSDGPVPVNISYTRANDAPRLTVPDAQTIDALNALRLDITATDSDRPRDTLTFSLSAHSYSLGATIDPLAGTFAWTPTEEQEGAHTITVHVTDNGAPGLRDTDTFTVTVGTALLAVAGQAKIVAEGSEVSLDGSGSIGPTVLTQAWTQIEGPAVELLGARTETPSFIAPNVTEPTLLRFQLIVTTTDENESEPAFLDVFVNYTDDDNDDLRDQWEVAHFGDLRFSAHDDPDGDGYTNAEEFAAATDPFSLVIELELGWNLISLTRQPINNSIADIFGNKISGAVWTWDARNRHFMTVDHLTAGQGYWVLANRDCTGDDAIVIHLP
jgi:type VI secretion system secreted protein Hcp